jgi:hypothetical protein
MGLEIEAWCWCEDVVLGKRLALSSANELFTLLMSVSGWVTAVTRPMRSLSKSGTEASLQGVVVMVRPSSVSDCSTPEAVHIISDSAYAWSNNKWHIGTVSSNQSAIYVGIYVGINRRLFSEINAWQAGQFVTSIYGRVVWHKNLTL